MTRQDLPHDPLLAEVDHVLSGKAPSCEVLHEVCRLLASQNAGWDWVGFYLVDPERPAELVLGPFVGEATEHVRIPFGRGICGQAAAGRRTLIIDDVSAEDNYLACSVKVKSEIVVPVWWRDQIIGELDIDSHTANRFSEHTRHLLEAVCVRAAPLVASCRENASSLHPVG